MKIHRFIGDYDLKQDKLRLAGDEAHQIRNVLKLKPAEQLILCNGQGNEAVAVVLDVGKNATEVGIQERRRNEVETAQPVTLYCAILKHENFELVIQKATEVGVSEIIPLITARTVKTEVKLDRLMKIAKEAAELSGRGKIPVVRPPSRFALALAHAAEDAAHFIFDASGKPFKRPATAGPSAAWIGPEGGWSEDELAQTADRGFRAANLGPRILRGETAAIVASYLLCA